MISLRRAGERGHFDHGWLDTYHTFSFAEYQDPMHMGFRCLRVINEDRVRPGEGFDTHGHRDMEILTYILSGALEHKDSMGTGSVIRVGDVQYMSAGKGVTHSEFNHSKKEPVHLLQIWILPDERSLAPRYEQQHLEGEEIRDRLKLIVSGTGEEGSIRIHQDVKILVSKPAAKKVLEYGLAANRHAWLQVAAGELDLNGERMRAGDGASISQERSLRIEALQESELLLFDLN